MLTLVIGNKNYSSWSMRPWVLLRQLGIPFEEILLKFHSDEWAARIDALSPSKLVPVCWQGPAGQPGSIAVWDTLAIMESVAEWFPERAVWPRDTAARAMARSMVAEMHAGFRSLRTLMPMNIRARHVGKGMDAEVAANIARIESLWREARTRHAGAGDYLFGEFSAADAMFAPVVMRFNTYQPPLADGSRAYCARVTETAAVAAWIREALREKEFVADDEPYCPAPATP